MTDIKQLARQAARAAVEYVECEGWFPIDGKTDVPDACADAVLAALAADRCPCTPDAPKHQHGAGGYCTATEQQLAADRLADAATALDAVLRKGVGDDDLTPVHRELIQALAAYGGDVDQAEG